MFALRRWRCARRARRSCRRALGRSAPLVFVALCAARARVGRAHALRPLARRAHRSARSPRSRAAATGSAPGCSGSARRRSSSRSCCSRSRSRGRGAGAAGARRSCCGGDLRRRGRARLPAVPRALAGRDVAEPRAAADAAAPDRDARRGAPARRAPGRSGSAITMMVEPRLAEPRRHAAGRARGVAVGRSRSPRSSRIWVAFARGPATASGSSRYSAAAIVRVRRARQGALAAVPDLARAARRARPRPARPRAAALLAVALVLTQLWFPYRYWDLALHFDAARVVARARARPASSSRCSASLTLPALRDRDANRLARRSAAVGVAARRARPRCRTPPSAGSKRTGIPVRMRWIASSALTPITESCGPVMPASVIAAVPPGRRARRSSARACASRARPSRGRRASGAIAIFSLVASRVEVDEDRPAPAPAPRRRARRSLERAARRVRGRAGP